MKDKIKTLQTIYTNNKDVIKRKVIVGAGTAVGMIIASAVLDRLGSRTPDIIYVEVPVTESTTVPTDTTAE